MRTVFRRYRRTRPEGMTRRARGKTQFVAVEPEPEQAKQQHEPHPFEAGTLRADGDFESASADHSRSRVGNDGYGKGLQADPHQAESKVGGGVPESAGSVCEGVQGYGRERSVDQGARVGMKKSQTGSRWQESADPESHGQGTQNQPARGNDINAGTGGPGAEQPSGQEATSGQRNQMTAEESAIR